MNLSGKRVLVIGMQASGISACNLLKLHGAEVKYFDDFVSPLSDFKNTKGETEENILHNLNLIVLSPAIPETHFLVKAAREKKIQIISELELGCSFLKAHKIVVTGTNGKTTTVCMLQKIISNMGFRTLAMGNIGYPVSQVILDKSHLDYAIIEASSFQLENIKNMRPEIAVILNIAPDHLDRYDDFNGYIEAKKRIFMNQKPDDFIILNYDDKLVRNMAESCKAHILWFSAKVEKGRIFIKDNYFFLDDIAICHIKECKAKGEHNRYNLLAAMNVALLLGGKKEQLLNLIRDYVPLPHRVEYVTTINGKSFYNDSKGTNIHACKFAIECLEESIGLIMGGSDKNEDYCDFFDTISNKVKYITLTGSNAEKIYDTALKMGFCDIKILPALKDCIDFLIALSDIKNILFSPSAASFDRYTNYAERGNIFKSLIYEIKI